MTGELREQVVVIGGGFGGLTVTKGLRNAPVDVTLVDRRNFHLFQPLLYQVATGSLAASDIAHPLRSIFKGHRNIFVLKAEVVDLNPAQQKIILTDGELYYDTLVVATGSSHHYFGHEEWSQKAPGLKTVEDALNIRRRILLALENAEKEVDPGKRRAWMTFVIVGGGPTGVELAGALAELTRKTLQGNFRRINPAESRILLLEGLERVLPPYPEELSAKAAETLTRLGVEVQTQTMVTGIQDGIIQVNRGKEKQKAQIEAKTILWGAGMKASPLGNLLAQQAGVQLDRTGRVIVEPDLTLPDHPNIFVIGDLANFSHQTGSPLPGLAAVAMQQGEYVAQLIQAKFRQETLSPFYYTDKGTMAIIGRNEAVADIKSRHLSGFLAWLIWLVVHIRYLIGFDNKLLVLFQWAWSYFTHKRGALLITNEDEAALAQESNEQAAVSSPILEAEVRR